MSIFKSQQPQKANITRKLSKTIKIKISFPNLLSFNNLQINNEMTCLFFLSLITIHKPDNGIYFVGRTWIVQLTLTEAVMPTQH